MTGDHDAHVLPAVMTEPVTYEGDIDDERHLTAWDILGLYPDHAGWSPWQMTVHGGAQINTPAADRLIALARGIAFGAHAGQVDKSGNPYVGHLERVAERLDHPLDKVAAWLHDVLEDTAVQPHDLLTAGIPAELVDTVRVLTHRSREPRVDYYARIRQDPRAVRVKLADIADNSDPARLAVLDEATRERLTAKYAKTREALGAP